MKAKQIVVATMVGRDAAHLGYVEERLQPIKLTQIDLRVPPFGLPLTFEDGPSHFRVLYGDTELDPSWIWWRAMPASLATAGLGPDQIPDWSIPVNDTGLGPDQVVDWTQPFALQNISKHVDALVAMLPETQHVSHPDAIRRGMLKPPQLKLARSLGWRTPRSIQTGSWRLARIFVENELALTGACIKKTIDGGAPIHPVNGPLGMPTVVLTADDVTRLHWSTLPLGPSIFQQLIVGDDVTIAVVGDQVFPARVISSFDESKSNIRDFRMGWSVVGGHVDCEAIKIADDDRVRCIEFVRRSGLKFARLDFIRDRAGNLWFLESNSSGAWAFLQDAGLKVGWAIADLMMSEL